jgi:hypothetical protein
MAETLTDTLNKPTTNPFAAVTGAYTAPDQEQRAKKTREAIPQLFAGARGAARREETLKSEAAAQQAASEIAGEERFLAEKEGAFKYEQEAMAPRPEPQITKFDVGAAGELAITTALLGAISGMVSGEAALASMEGFTRGHKEGREDLYRKEVQKFERDVAAWKDRNKMIQDEVKNIVDLAGTRRDVAKVKAKQLSAQLRDGLLKATLDKEDYVGALKLLEPMQKLENDLTKQAAKASGRQAGQRELMFATRVFGNIVNAAQDLGNLMISPSVAQSPVFSGLINVDPETVFGSLRSLVARNITKPEERAFDQVANSLSAALSRIEAQGLASGSTQRNIAAFDSLRPRAGDSAINMALYLARVKQEIEAGVTVFKTMSGATPEQIAMADQINTRLNSLVPFSVDTVFQVMTRSGKTLDDKMQRLLKLPNTARLINPNPSDLMNVQTAPQAGAPAPAPRAGQPPATPKTATMGNVRATANNRNITEAEARQLYIDRGYTIQD